MASPLNQPQQLNFQQMYEHQQQQIQQLHQQFQQQLQQQQVGQAAPNQHQNQSYHPKIRQPNIFKGEIGSYVDDWLNEFEQQFEYFGNRFSTSRDKILFASNYLTGSALRWWQKISIDERNALEWNEFVELCRKRFRPADAARTARIRLSKFQQRTGRSVNEYINGFQLIMNSISDMSESDQVYHFVIVSFALSIFAFFPILFAFLISFSDFAVKVFFIVGEDVTGRHLLLFSSTS